ncbi:MAG TPA: radical SAM protein [Longimicrobium sp.]|jgi:cytosylglucuronate decarboxylase|uniref:radical SAM protein n=1 Tax=Longimicrobium sp. TaxID=2029185 RepID=UPI002EDB272E
MNAPLPVFQRTSPKIVYVRILEACNAGCRMCPFANSSDPFRLAVERVRTLAVQLAALGGEEVRFTGGEPTLHEGLLEAVAEVRAAGLRVSLITNGSRLAEMAAPLLDAGLSAITCSLDSPRPEIHDGLRRTPGLFAAAIAGLETLATERARRGRSLPITVNTIVSAETFRDIHEFVPLLDRIGVDFWTLIPIKDKKSLYLTADEAHEFSASVVPRIEARLERARVRLNAVSPHVFGTSDAARVASAGGRLPTHTRCFVPDVVGYIDARRGLLTACNCLPHRRGRPLSLEGVWDRPFGESWNEPGFAGERAAFASVASQVCTGCEPGNVRFNRDADLALSAAGWPDAQWL